MGTNFKISDKSILEDNPELKSIPEFERLTERQLRYVFLVELYNSPLRLMKVEDRKLKSALVAGYKFEKSGTRPDMNCRNLIAGKVGNVEAARKMLKELQYDLEREIKDTLEFQIEEVLSFIKKADKTPDELKKAVEFSNKLSNILENRKKILEILNFREQNIVEQNEDENILSNTEDFSLLDEFNQNT